MDINLPPIFLINLKLPLHRFEKNKDFEIMFAINQHSGNSFLLTLSSHLPADVIFDI